MPEGNPLVAESKKDPDGPGAFTAGNGDYGWAGGIGIAESSMDAFNGIKDGDWVSGGLGVLSLAGEIAGAAIDPFGYLMSSVASFLMEHVQPLKDMLDSVAGNPPVIQSYADTWGNVSKALGERKTDFDNAVKNGTTGWTGAGADSYRAFAAEHSDALSGAATVAGAISTVTMIMGQVVSFVRETVRQLIADLVGKLIAWVMEEVFSLGFGTPVVVAQATAAIAKWGKKIGELLKKLTDTIRKVSPLLSKLVDLFEKIAKVFGKVLGKVSGLDGLKVKEGGFVHKVSKGEGGGVHARGHGDSDSGGSSGGDGESAPSHADGDTPPGEGSASRTRSGDSAAGDESPSHAGDSGGSPAHASESAPSHAGDTGGSPAHAGESAPSHAGDTGGSPTHAGESAPSHAGDTGGSPTHAGDSNASPSGAPSHAGDSSPSAARGGDNTPSHTGNSGPSAARSGDNTPSHTGGSSPSPTRGGDGSPSHAGDSGPARGGDASSHSGDSSPSPTRSGDSGPSPARGSDNTPAHSGSAPAARADAPGAHAGTDTPSSAAPPRADGTTSASGSAPTAPRIGDPGTQFPSPRGGDGAIPPQGGQPMMGGGMPPGGAPGGGGLGGGSPRTGGGSGWTGTPGSPGASTPHVDAPGRPRTGGDLPEGRPRPRTPETPAPAARGFGPGTTGPATRPGGPGHTGPGSPGHSGPGSPGHTSPGGPGHTGPSGTGHTGSGGPGGPGHNGPGGPHDPASGHGPHENGPHENGPHDPDSTPPHHGDEPLTPDEVNARHAESTPSGSSYHAGDPEMGDLPHRVRPDADGRYTVDVHVTPDGHARIGNRLYTPEEFADILRRNADYDGRPIRLIGCDASSNDFAHRLSRELDTEVMAPTKPAWTDSHGRVFSSDYEIGPDGRMRPRIPPDGEWNTHHPDGSVHPAGEDGFTPDTHESHKHDVDADDAVERGRRPIPSEPVEIETRQPPASTKEKINDLDYRNKYYDGPDTNGEFKRKNAEQFDHNGDRVHKIREDTDKDVGERFETKSDDYVPAGYREDIPEVDHRATKEQQERAQQLIDERAEANAHARSVEQDYRAHRDAGTLTDELEEQRAAAHKARTDYGEQLGEHAASDAVADRFPPDRYDVKELPDPAVHGDNTRPGGGEKPGAGRFDQIYAVTDRTTGETRHVIVEAKGPNAELGTRRGVDGKTNYEQGHPLYVDSVIANMRKNGTPAEQALADDLEMAKELGQLDYSVAKAKVREEVVVGTDGQPVTENGKPVKKPVYGGYNLKHFDMNVTSR